MATTARRFRVGESTFDLDAHTLVVATVARPPFETSFDAWLGEIDESGADIVLVTSLPAAGSALGATVEHIRNRTRLPVVVEVADAAGAGIALRAGAGGVAAPEAVVDGAFLEALVEGDGSLFWGAPPRTVGSRGGSGGRATSSLATELGPDRLAIEPPQLSAPAIATYAVPAGGDEVLVLSTSEPTPARRRAAIALGVGRGWPAVRVDEATSPGEDDGPSHLVSAVRVIRMIDAIRAAESTTPGGDAR